MQSTPAQIAKLITALICEPILNVNYSFSELDESKLIVMADSWNSEEADDNSSNHLGSEYHPNGLEMDMDLETLRVDSMNLIVKSSPCISIAV